MDANDHYSCPPATGRPVRVGLDASRLGTGRGPERFTSVLVQALLTEPCGVRLSLYVRDDNDAVVLPDSLAALEVGPFTEEYVIYMELGSRRPHVAQGALRGVLAGRVVPRGVKAPARLPPAERKGQG